MAKVVALAVASGSILDPQSEIVGVQSYFDGLTVRVRGPGENEIEVVFADV